jgi:ribosomal protein S20
MNKFEELYNFIDRAVKSRKYPENTGIALKTGLKLFEKELNEEEKASIDEFKKNLNQISNSIFSKGKFNAASLATYKSRIIKVINDYEKYGKDATKMANWSPKVIVRPKRQLPKDETQKSNSGQAGIIKNDSFHAFDFTGGVKLLIPKTPTTNDAIMDGGLKDIKVALKDFSEKYCKEEEQI